MKRHLSDTLQLDIRNTAESAILFDGAVNVPILAEQIRLRNLQENVAFEDIEAEILQVARTLNATMVFDRGVLLADDIRPSLRQAEGN